MTQPDKKRWTQDEENRLVELFASHSIPEIAEVLNRPIGSVASKALGLGLSKRSIKSLGEVDAGATYHPQPGVLIHRSIKGRY